MRGRFRLGLVSGLGGGEMSAFKPGADSGSCRVLELREQPLPELDSGCLRGGVSGQAQACSDVGRGLPRCLVSYLAATLPR